MLAELTRRRQRYRLAPAIGAHLDRCTQTVRSAASCDCRGATRLSRAPDRHPCQGPKHADREAQRSCPTRRSRLRVSSAYVLLPALVWQLRRGTHAWRSPSSNAGERGGVVAKKRADATCVRLSVLAWLRSSS